MDITIHLLREADAAELFEFERKNRLFFEEMVPSRGEEYYQFETFSVRHQELLLEQERGLSLFYLIKNEAGEIAGRLNLVDIDKMNNIADIGFRIGEAHAGKGIASQALHVLLKTKLGVRQIRGKTTNVNYASQKVLENNGFQQTSVSEEFEMNGNKVRFIHYLWG